jgi:hypothetical protein
MQFVVLVAIAMLAYPGGTWLDPTAARYELSHNFLSDLGATRAFSGRASYTSAALFALALATIGSALVAFAPTWRGFAFAHGRARGFGIASTVFGCASGAAFVGVAASPVDLALHAHNAFVVAGFALLACYAVCLAIVMRQNGVGRLAIDAVYVLIVGGYFALALLGPRLDTEHGFAMQVVAQKVVVAISMLYVAIVTTRVRGLTSASPGRSPP